MSASDLSAVVARAIPAALSLYKVQVDNGTLEGILDVVGDLAKRAARYSARGKLDDTHRDKLHRDACDEISCVAPELAASAVERLGEIVIDVIDEHTDTGPLDEVDGEVAQRGLAALAEKVEDWLDSMGNLEARIERARRQAAAKLAKAEKLEKVLAQKRAAQR